MKKVLFLMFMLFLIISGTANLKAQVRIGGTAGPHGSAVLDLNADDADEPAGNFGGFLLPRIQLEETDQTLNGKIPLDGAIVWNTNDNFYLGKGVYVWGNGGWVPIQRTLAGNSSMQPIATAPTVEVLSNPALGLGVTFQVPTSYGDMNNTARFIWEITANGEPSYDNLVPSVSGSRQEVVFVPYDGTERTYTAKVKAIPNNGAPEPEWWSEEEVVSTPGKYQSWYRITGPTGYDILVTPYNDPTKRDDNGSLSGYNRTLTGTYAVEPVAGPTPVSYQWSISRDPGGHASLSTPNTNSEVEFTLNGNILSDGDLVNKPGVADTIVLQCTVNDGHQDYILERTITVGDRDECSPVAGLLDAEGNSYTISRFGGVCWMTQNLRSKKTKQGNQVQTIPEGTNESNDPNAVVYYYPGGNTNSPFEYGFLYTWGAANIGTETTEAKNAFIGKTSDRQGICPEGWTLPSDYDWNQLEEEIATHPEKYSSEQTAYTWNSSYETYTGWRPGEGNSGLNWWGRTMKSSTRVKTANNLDVSTAPNGVSNKNGTGFNALIVGTFGGGSSINFGSGTSFWSSSAVSATAAWRRSLDSSPTGAYRTTNNKYNLHSVRCKK
ncbi:MAG: fibrobacter succinogenes major paralogous domain-containing protein [Candidatus Symbiothrix sp.]|jgi:uncharacterized protein (TIGR02145 family)|nr:fibrobacter succinogenes major paralogous domain-containing protein [Candidatus Symbiothrix sp.]